MKEWKIRQHLFHKIAQPTDISNSIDYRDCNLVENIVEYFTIEQAGHLRYPAKSYAVAIIYATLLAYYFEEDFFVALANPALLYGNDQFFIPYSNATQTYDRVLERLLPDILEKIESNSYSQVQATVKYFKQEFLLM